MQLIDKLEAFVNRLSMGIEWVGLIAFISMMFITTIDVLGAKLFLAPLPGSLDIMMMAQLIGMSFAIASGLILGRHIQVEFFVVLFPKMIQNLVEVIANVLGLILFILITWQLLKYGYDLNLDGEVSPTISMPLYPFAIASGFACIPVCLVYLASSIKAIQKVLKI